MTITDVGIGAVLALMYGERAITFVRVKWNGRNGRNTANTELERVARAERDAGVIEIRNILVDQLTRERGERSASTHQQIALLQQIVNSNNEIRDAMNYLKGRLS